MVNSFKNHCECFKCLCVCVWIHVNSPFSSHQDLFFQGAHFKKAKTPGGQSLMCNRILKDVNLILLSENA